MKIISIISLLWLFLGCESRLTFNSLVCPTNDENVIISDLTQCKVYDLEAVDKAMLDPNCKQCLEEKGYRVIETNSTK